jgi:hypothetical protein
VATKTGLAISEASRSALLPSADCKCKNRPFVVKSASGGLTWLSFLPRFQHVGLQAGFLLVELTARREGRACSLEGGPSFQY